MASIIQTIEGVVTNKFVIESVLNFGRSADNQVQIDDLEVSTKHAQITCDVDNEGTAIYFLEDLGSTNGSFINEEKIKKQQLHHKDNIRIGWNIFTFIDEDEINHEKTREIKKSWIPGVFYSKDK
ncbi:MAG: FHA domain-containing protein [Gammaproteobacteria bacterium]|nr:FHA domain-containing protein [Gammaproteobacteria bacterium]MCW8922615.1 FHA domain-containing protein [Gammaproteobacteria bacterium]